MLLAMDAQERKVNVFNVLLIINHQLTLLVCPVLSVNMQHRVIILVRFVMSPV